MGTVVDDPRMKMIIYHAKSVRGNGATFRPMQSAIDSECCIEIRPTWVRAVFRMYMYL